MTNERTENTLDKPLDEFEAMMAKAMGVVKNRYATMYDDPVHQQYSAAEIASWFDEKVPAHPMETDALLSLVDTKVMQASTLNIGPHMYSYVMAGGNQVGVVADMMAAAINQNGAKWHLSPAMTEIEKRVIVWTAEFCGLPNHKGGAIVSGGSDANLHGLNVAKAIFFEKYDIRKKGVRALPEYALYTSVETHGSVDKSLEFTGLGSANLRHIAVDGQAQIDLSALRRAIEVDVAAGITPFCVIGNAGTVNTGAIDDLDAIADLAAEFNMWFHVDGCYGGLASALPELSACYKGMERADSVAVDFHKWLYQPYEVACTLVKDFDTMRRAYHKPAAYLDVGQEGKVKFDVTEHHFSLSRNSKAFKVWMTFKAYGAEKITAMIRKDIALTHYLKDQVEASDDFETACAGPLGSYCFRYKGNRTDIADIDTLNLALVPALEADRRVFLMGTKIFDRPALRSCIINHRKQQDDIDYLLAVVRDVASRL